MLDERELATVPASNKFAAVYDAERYSDECRMRYSGAERARAETFCDVARLAYLGRLYVNYRKGFIAVKIDRAETRDRQAVKVVDQICEERGYVKAHTPQGIVFRIPRKK